MNENFDNFELQLSEVGKEALRGIAKWAAFLAILGFIGLGLMVVAALIMFAVGAATTSLSNNLFARMGGGVIGGIYLVLALLYFFPIYYLYKFSAKTKSAFLSSDSADLNEGLRYLKSHYKFIGILTIIVISLYVLAIPVFFMYMSSMGSI